MYNRRFLSLFAIMAALLWPVTSHANSLYNPKEAQKLSKEQLSQFGPNAKNFRYDKRMIHAAQIAAQRARRSSTSRCWRYVKGALLAANVIDSYPKTAYAKEAAGELTKSYGFTKLHVSNPYAAPVGSVLVYGGKGAGHVEIKTPTGFVSDFASATPSHRPLLGVFVKAQG